MCLGSREGPLWWGTMGRGIMAGQNQSQEELGWMWLWALTLKGQPLELTN